MSTSSSATAQKSQPAPADINNQYNRFKNELQMLATKIGELEGDIDEHQLVLSTLQPLLKTDPSRKCFRLIGGILVERTVVEIEPMLRTNTEGIKNTLDLLIKQYRTREQEFSAFQKKHNIQVVTQK